MADERPDPAHTPPGGPGAVDPIPAATLADATGAPDASPDPEIEALDAAALEGRRSVAEGLRDVLTLPALGVTTKAVSVAQMADPEHLLRLLKRWRRRTPTVADVMAVCLVAKVAEMGRQTVSAFAQIADRLEGTPRQTVNLQSEVKVVSAEPMSLADWELQAIATGVKALPPASAKGIQ